MRAQSKEEGNAHAQFLKLTRVQRSNYKRMSSLESSITEEEASTLMVGTESRGSSVSTEMREEYEDLLRYAVVMPTVGKDASNPALPTVPSPSKAAHSNLTTARSGPPTPQPVPPRPHQGINKV